MRRLLSSTLLLTVLFVVGIGFFRVVEASEESEGRLEGQEGSVQQHSDQQDLNVQNRAENSIAGSNTEFSSDNDESGTPAKASSRVFSPAGKEEHRSRSFADTPSSVRVDRGSSFHHSPYSANYYSPFMSSPYLSRSSRSSLQAFQEISEDPNVQEEHILTKLQGGAYFVKAPPAVTSGEEGSAHREIVEDFKNALTEKYGEKIVEHVFSSHEKGAEASGLTLGKIRQLVEQAEANQKLQDQTQEGCFSPNVRTGRGDFDRTSSRLSLGSPGPLGVENGPRRRSMRFWVTFRQHLVTKGVLTEEPSKSSGSKIAQAASQLIAREAPFKARREATQTANDLREIGFSKLNQIETETQEKLKEVKSKYGSQYDRIRNRAAVARARGISPDAPTERKKKDDVAKAISHEQVEAFFQAEYPRYNAEKKIITSFLPRRNVLSELVEREQTVIALHKIDEISTGLLASITEQENRSDEISLLTMETLRVAEAMKFFVLGRGTQEVITAAKMDLAEAKRLLTEASIGGEDQSLFQSTQQLLDSASIDFSFAGAQSPRVAAAMAEKKATVIRDELEKIKNSIAKNQKVRDSPETSVEGKERRNKKIETLEKISKSLEIAAFSYEQLWDENEIECITGPLLSLKEGIEKRILDLTPADSNNESIALISSALNALYKNFLTLAETLEEKYSQPQNPCDFLDELDQLGKEQDSDKIIGANGKIALLENKDFSCSSALGGTSSISSAVPLFSDEEKKAWREGIDLIRFGLCRNFNIRAVQRFDEEFKDQFIEGNSLSVGELKKFIEQEKVLHASSHFMSPPDDIEDFLERLNRAEENKIVKWDERTMSFNPFAGESAGIEEGDSAEVNKQEIADGRSQARKAIENIFTAASVPEETTIQILERFDLQFPPIDLGSQERITPAEFQKLTVGELRFFIEKETAGTNVDSRSFLSRFVITSKMLEGANYGLGSVLAGAVAGALLHTYIPLAIHGAPGAWHAFKHWVSGAGAAAATGSAR